MRRSFVLLFMLFFALSARGGMTYRFESTTTGPVAHRLAGTVRAEGTMMRVDITRGDGVTFRDGAVILSVGPAQPLLVLEPRAKRYFELRPEDLAGGSALRSLTGMVDLGVENEKVSSRDAGPGGRLAGYDTRRTVMTSSFDLLVKGLGQTMRSKISISVQSWTTDKISPALTSVLQMRGVKTGVAAIDRLIAAQSTTARGFPLRQISTIRFNDTVATTTTNVSNVATERFPATLFLVPNGFTKVVSPMR